MNNTRKIFNKPESQSFIRIILLFLSAVVAITICSKSSPLYPFNDWDDSNCFFTVGKAMVNGKILYKDIFEQKGPLLYMLHMLTYKVSNTTFLGVYFAEIIACFVFLYYSGRIMSLFCGGKIFYMVFPFTAFTYTSLSFCCGDSAEEWCLPLLSYTLYIALESVKNKHLVKAKSILICGISMGIVLWIKFTMLGFFIGFIIAFIVLYIRQKQYRSIGICTIAMLTGVLIASVPVILYFTINKAFPYLFEVYFYDNIFLYSTGNRLPVVLKQVVNLLSGILSFELNNTFGFIFTILGIIRLFRKEEKDLRFVFCVIFGTTFFFTFVGGRAYAYYSLVMTVFAPVGMAGVYEFFVKKISSMRIKKVAPVLVCVISVILTAVLCRNTYLIFIPKEDMPQFRFNRIISQTENATLLNYGFLDGGFYTVSGIVPNCRYFCGLNLKIEDIEITQREFAEQGIVDYIVTKDLQPDFDRYECVDKCDFIYWSEISTYYLYKRTE